MKVGDKRIMYCNNCKANKEFEVFRIDEKVSRNGIKTVANWTCENKECLDTVYTTEYLIKG